MATTFNTLSFFVHRTRQIYTLPAVALEVLELTDHPRVDCRKIKECIEHDPALVGKILRVVNSSLFGLGSDVTDLNQALALLGIKSLKLLVLGFSLSEAMFADRTGEALQHTWRHALSRAVAARELCEFTWHVPGDEAFIAGLLAGLGRFVLLDEVGQPYADLLMVGVHDQESLAVLEKSSLGFDSTELSAELLRYWNLPQPLVAAVNLSSHPEQIGLLERPEIMLPAAVWMAGLLADLVVDNRHDCLRELVRMPGGASPVTASGLDSLRLTEPGLAQLVDRVQERVDALAEALSFDLPPGKDYRDVLAEAHERLALVASDAACAVARQWPIAERSGVEVAGVSKAVARYVQRFANETELPRPRSAPAAVVAERTPPRLPEEPAAKPPAPADSNDRLLDRLTVVVGICRQARCSLALVLFEVDHFRNVELAYGAAEARNFVRRLHLAAARVDHPGAICIQVGEARFALVITGCERRAAVQVGQQLIHAMPTLVSLEKSLPDPPTLSVGVASVSMVSKNFPPTDLLQAATRCLDAAHLSGGNTLKSIDVY